MARTIGLCALLLALAAPDLGEAAMCRGGRSGQTAMWLSIAHPGVGEWYLQDWGPIERAPQRKFWLGFIPLYGWPGYLQVKSAIDSSRCQTNDELVMREEPPKKRR